MKDVMNCAYCADEYQVRRHNQTYCTRTCYKSMLNWSRPNVEQIKNVTCGNAGKAVEMIVAARLMLKGWKVFVPAGPNSSTDIIAFKGSRVRYLECRLGHISPKTGRVYYSTKVNIGCPRPTEFAVYIRKLNKVYFFPV